MKRHLRSSVLIAGLMLSVAAHAQISTWTGSINNDFHTANNWDIGVVPDTLGRAPVIDLDPGAVFTQTATNDWCNIGSTTSGTLTMNSGSFALPRTDGWFTLGVGFGALGTLNMNGGTMTLGNDCMIGAHFGGSGTLNMNGGVITTRNLQVPFALEGENVSQQLGRVNLSNGVINVEGVYPTLLTGGLLTNERGLINITEGQLNVAGDYVVAIQTNQVANGQITAYGGEGVVQVIYNSGSGMTEITGAELGPITPPTCWIDAGNLFWSSTNYVVYAVEYKTDLTIGTWQELTNGIAATPFTNSIPLPLDTHNPAFFQVTADYE